jgi:predicted nuclease with TOPRIM domain
MDIAQGLADAINDYEHLKNHDTYEGCKKWINFAYTHSFIITGASVEQVMKWKDNKIATLEQRILDLEREYDALNETHKKILDENISLKGRYEECNDKYDKLVNAFSGKGNIQR